MPRALWLLLALALGCAPEPISDTLTVRITASADQPLNAAAIRYEPADNARSARLSAQGYLAIERRDRMRALTVHIPQMCPVSFAAGPQREPIEARAVIDLGRDRPPVGFDTPFAITVQHGCPERGRGRITWRQVEGAAVSELAVERDGFSLRARTPRFEALQPAPVAPGIVPFSPRTQGRVVLEALFQAPGSPPIKRSVAILSTSRSTGLSSVAVSQQLLLAGEGWRVQKAPASGHAQVHASGALAAFTPDAPGRWTLEASAGETLVLQALWHDKTPYDCGRSECHGSIAETTLSSPMSSALQRHMQSSNPAPVGCMLDCHVLGERGVRDGGFIDVATQLGFSWLEGTRWDELPQALRRLGGVRCTACHGPGVLPEPEARELVLRSDVCASCHDAPPRYVHVEEWRASRMARSDAAPGTRSGQCAGCHTTSGFLERVAGRAPRAHSQSAAPTGIACAACHAPHSTHRGDELVRSMPASASDLPDARAVASRDPSSALCLACHAPAPGQTLASAPSGALWQGQVRVPAANGEGWEVLRAASAHGEVKGGCVGCHGATKDGRVDHSFRVDAASCKTCHAAGSSALSAAPQQELEQRARALAQALEPSCPSSEPASKAAHASPRQLACKTPQRTRAMYAVNVLLEDRAAWVHNAALARLLLQDAEQSASIENGVHLH